MSRNGTCYGCGATIRWVKLAPKFKPHPVDPAPSTLGTIHADDRGRATILPRDSLERARAGGVELFISHFATCPESNRMRRPNTPIPEPATPVRTLAMAPTDAPTRATPLPFPIPRARERERPLTEGEITYLEAERAASAVPQTTFGTLVANKAEPDPKNRAERRALAFSCSRCNEASETIETLTANASALQSRLASISTAAGYLGRPAGGVDDGLVAHIREMHEASRGLTRDERDRLRLLEQKERELRALLDEARRELNSLQDVAEIGNAWLHELRELRAEYEARAPTTSRDAALAVRAALRELAARMGYRLRE